jgi:hypothetical protein
VAGEVAIVADQMLPVAPLPEVIFAAPIAIKRNDAGEWHALPCQRAGETRLDRPSTPSSPAAPRGANDQSRLNGCYAGWAAGNANGSVVSSVVVDVAGPDVVEGLAITRRNSYLRSAMDPCSSFSELRIEVS